MFSCFPISCVLRIRSETAFDEYLQRDLRLIKSGNLARYAILSLVIWEFNSLIGGVGGARGVYQADSHWVGALKWRVSGADLINDRPYLKTGVITSLIPFLFMILFLFSCMHVCECERTVTMDQALSFPRVTHLITAPSFLIPNSVGRACQTAYAERRGDFEMLLMTLGYNYPLSLFTPPHSFSFLSTPVIYTRGHPLSWFCAALWMALIRNSTEGGRKRTRGITFSKDESNWMRDRLRSKVVKRLMRRLELQSKCYLTFI